MVDGTSPGEDADTSRIEALKRARKRRPWTDELVIECASNPVVFKDQLPACTACSEPCEADEVCATAVAKSERLFESMSRQQAYHLVESAMKRLRTRGEAEHRDTDSERPNSFVALLTEEPLERESDDEPARDERCGSGSDQQFEQPARKNINE